MGAGIWQTTQGSQRRSTSQYREMSDLTTVSLEKPENLYKSHPGGDMVLQELRAISSRLSQVEHSIDSQSNTRTSTPHRIPPVYSIVVQGCNEASGIAVPVSFSSVGVCFASGLPLSTMACVGCQYTSPLRIGYVPQVVIPNRHIIYILCILLLSTQQLPQLSRQFMVAQLAAHGRDRAQQRR